MPDKPRTERGRASRERIVERAAELFAERGVAATSLDEVLAAAGAGKSQLYHYFHGRDELVAAAVGLRCTQVLAGLTQALGAVASLAELEQALAGFVAGFEQMGLPGCPIGSLAALATALLASIEGGMMLSQTRKDAASLRVAVDAGLGQVRTQVN